MSAYVTEGTANPVGYTSTKATAVLAIVLILIIIAVIIFILFVRQSSPNTGDPCRDSSECSAGESCVATSGIGLCRKDPGQPCTVGANQCQSGQNCVQGTCQTISVSGLNKKCSPGTTNICPSSLICQNELCKADIKSSCTVLSDCIDTATGCVSGKCVKATIGQLTGPCSTSGSPCGKNLVCSPATNICLSVGGTRCSNGNECFSGVCSSGACTRNRIINMRGIKSFSNMYILSSKSPISGSPLYLNVAPDSINSFTTQSISGLAGQQSVWSFEQSRQTFTYDSITCILTVQTPGVLNQEYVTLDQSCGCRVVRIPITDQANPIKWKIIPTTVFENNFRPSSFKLSAIVNNKAFPLGTTAFNGRLNQDFISATVKRNQFFLGTNFLEFPLYTIPQIKQ